LKYLDISLNYVEVSEIEKNEKIQKIRKDFKLFYFKNIENYGKIHICQNLNDRTCKLCFIPDNNLTEANKSNLENTKTIADYFGNSNEIFFDEKIKNEPVRLIADTIKEVTLKKGNLKFLPDVIIQCEHLLRLNLSESKLNDKIINDINKLSNLTHLDLSNNFIEKCLTKDIFKDIKVNSKYLNLPDNQIE
jgi:hypothetical protein